MIWHKIGFIFSTYGLILFTFLSPANSQEPAQDFIAALRAKGLYDLADDYLEQAKSSRIVAESFRERIALEQVENLVQSTAATRSIAVQIERLAQAEEILKAFMESDASADLKASAIETLASLRFRQGGSYLRQGENDRLTQNEKADLMLKAQTAFADSLSAFEQAREQLRPQIEKLTTNSRSNPALLPELKQLENLYTQVRLRSPLVKEYLADTYTDGGAERKRLLGEAAAEYKILWDKYHAYSAGADACLYAARSLNKLAQPQEALTLVKELLEIEDKPDNRNLRMAAALVAIDVWNNINPYPFEQVIFYLEPMIANLTNSQQQQDTWAQIQLGLAQAYRAKATKIQADGGSTTDAARNNRLAAAMATRVARTSGASRQTARDLLTTWNVEINENENEGLAEAMTFTDAKAQAVKVLPDLEDNINELNSLKSSLSSAAPADASGIEAQIVTAQQKVTAAAKNLLARLNQALKFSLEEVEPQDANNVRYLQAFAHYAQGNYYHTATLGTFAVERLSGVDWSRQTAGLGIKAFVALYEQNAEGDREFELNKLDMLAKDVLSRWPGTSEADLAASVLSRLAIINNDPEAAKRYLDQMSSNGTSRAGLQLIMGQQKWREYKQFKKSLSAEQQLAQSAELKTNVQAIAKEFESGLKDIDPAQITYDAAYSALLLANAQLELGDSNAAVNQLENASVAPLDLIKQNHPAIAESSNAEAFLREVYRTAINAYLASMKSGTDTQTWISKTQGVLQALRDHLEKTVPARANAEITAIYRQVAEELKEQFSGVQNSEEKTKMADNLATFLDSVSVNTNDASILIWVGQTLFDIGETLKTNGEGNEDSQRIFAKAIDVLQKAEKADLSQYNDPALELLRIRRTKALALAGAENYEAAVSEIGALLGQRSALELQIDGANILTEWGVRSKNVKALSEAIMGGGPKTRDSKTKREVASIWGWQNLIKQTRGKAELINFYHTANLGHINAQIEYGVIANEPKGFAAAKRELDNTFARYPDLGGVNFKQRYEALKARANSK